jgi:hypothetical protein
MNREIDIERFLSNMGKYAATKYDYSYYLVAYELKRMQVAERIGSLTPSHMRPIFLFLRDWMLSGWIKWTEDNWENMDTQLCNCLNKLSEEFHELENTDLLHFEILHQAPTRSIFEEISKLKLGASQETVATVASKILHLLNSGLFVIWDTRIIRSFKCTPNAEGYLGFLTQMKSFAEELRPYLGRINETALRLRTKAEEKYGLEVCSEKSLAKLIDEHNWIETR